MGFKSPKLNFYVQTMPRRFLVDTTYIGRYICVVKQLAIKTKHLIHVDFLVLVCEFVVVAILSEWWSLPSTTDHCGHIPVNTYVNVLV